MVPDRESKEILRAAEAIDGRDLTVPMTNTSGLKDGGSNPS